MLKNHFKTAIRQILRNRVVSFTNLSGLGMALVTCCVIFSYVVSEFSYDRFHAGQENIYRVVQVPDPAEEATASLKVPSLLAPEAVASMAQVKTATRMILPWSGQGVSSTLVLSENDKTMKHSFYNGFFVDPGFMEVFSFPMIKGDRSVVLSSPGQVVISERLARLFFGEGWIRDPSVIGSRMEYINEFDRFDLTITGVIADAPPQSHFDYDFLASFSTLATGWSKGFIETHRPVFTYFKLDPKANPKTTEHELSRLLSNSTAENRSPVRLQSISDIHFHSRYAGELKPPGNLTLVYGLLITGVVIFSLALINYFNITTVRVFERSKELGLRKMIGAGKQTMWQLFLMEALLMNLIAAFIGFTLLQVLKAGGYPVAEYLVTDPWLTTKTALIVSMIFLTVACFYPAFLSSSLKVSSAMKGTLPRSGRHHFRNGTTMFQFAVSIVLVVFTFIVYHQVQFLLQADAGFDKTGVLIVESPQHRSETWIEHFESGKSDHMEDPFIQALDAYTGIEAVSISESVPGDLPGIDVQTHGSENFDFIKVDDQYAAVYDLEMVAGEFDVSGKNVLNETAVQALGYVSAAEVIGSSVMIAGHLREISGVVKDYHHRGLHQPVLPVVHGDNDFTYNLDLFYSIKMTSSDMPSLVATIEKVYHKVFPDEEFTARFADSFFQRQYDKEVRQAQAFQLFSGLAIFISCIGLFSLTLIIARQKTKEIGIRKVLGGTVYRILRQVSGGVWGRLSLSVVLALPLSWYTVDIWLTRYANRIALEWWYFVLPALLVVVMACLPSAIHFILAARKNPVDSLRYE